MKIEAPAYTYKGKLRLRNEPAFKSQIAHLVDSEGMLTYDTDTKKKTKRQRGYYWSTIVPHTLIIMRDEAGNVEYESNDDAHLFLKYRFNPKWVTDPETGEKERLPGSTKKMKKEQAKHYIDSIVLWAYTFFNYTYPPPRRGEDKYFIEE